VAPRLEMSWHDGFARLVMSPLEFMQRWLQRWYAHARTVPAVSSRLNDSLIRLNLNRASSRAAMHRDHPLVDLDTGNKQTLDAIR
jgi:hypothetical protein